MKASLYQAVESSFELMTKPGSFVSKINEIFSLYKIKYDDPSRVKFDLITNQLINYLKDKELLSEFIFMEMWRQQRPEMKVIAVQLLPIFIQNPRRREIQYLNMVLRQATRKVELKFYFDSLSVIFQRNIRIWYPYFQIILNSENTEMKRYGIFLLDTLAAKNKKMIPQFRLLLAHLARTENAEINKLARQTLNKIIDYPRQTESGSSGSILIINGANNQESNKV